MAGLSDLMRRLTNAREFGTRLRDFGVRQRLQAAAKVQRRSSQYQYHGQLVRVFDLG